MYLVSVNWESFAEKDYCRTQKGIRSNIAWKKSHVTQVALSNPVFPNPPPGTH